jgi:hypothetical protein
VLTVALPFSTAAQDPGWPREITSDDARLVYYQPQIDGWKEFKKVSGRMAIGVTPRGDKARVGIVELQMHTPNARAMVAVVFADRSGPRRVPIASSNPWKSPWQTNARRSRPG